MPKPYVHNPTAGAIFVGGVLIAPGEGREVDELYLPAEHADAEGEGASAGDADPAPDLQANLRELLAQPVKDLLPQLDGLGTDTLDELARLEGEDAAPRKTLLSAIGEIKLERAKLATQG